jgi:glycerol-3-phosphate acyltransferase PlsY
MTTVAIICIIVSYLVGAIPFGLLLSRTSGVNIRTAGSGNIGATNVARLLGKKMGTITLLLDISKGFLPIYIASLILKGDPNQDIITALCGAAAVIGHLYPIYLGFKGGKGVATGLGVFLFLAPPALLFSLVLFIIVVKISGFVSLGSLLASASIPFWLYLLDEPGWKLVLSGFIGIMIWWKHNANIKRLLSGTEKRWKKRQPHEP